MARMQQNPGAAAGLGGRLYYMASGGRLWRVERTPEGYETATPEGFTDAQDGQVFTEEQADQEMRGEPAVTPEPNFQAPPAELPNQPSTYSAENFPFAPPGSAAGPNYRNPYGGLGNLQNAGRSGTQPDAMQAAASRGGRMGNVPDQRNMFAPGTVGSMANQNPAAAGGALGANSAAGGGVDPGIMGALAQFSTDNPQFAFQNAMRNAGMNPFQAGNPFVQMLQRAAPGMALAFQMQRMKDQSITGENPPTTGAGSPADFGAFLTNAIKGGNVFNTLSSTGSGLRDAINMIRNQGQGLLSGATNASNMNPFIAAVANLLEANSGQGTTAALGALYGPFMSRSMLQAYQEGLNAAASTALYNQAGGPSGQANTNKDIWSFLLGMQ